jgi:mono/diheme cytochrome c family protein
MCAGAVMPDVKTSYIACTDYGGIKQMIKINHKITYHVMMGVMSLAVLFITATIASSGGSGHTHEEEGVHGLEIPEKYQGKNNPYWSDLDAVVSGSKIYKDMCAKCHGVSGNGDGPLAKTMSKKPFSFMDSSHMSQMNDGYLYWRTVEGGTHPPFKSKMPAYKDKLTEKEVWQVLSYAHAFSHKHLLSHTHSDGEKVAMAEKQHHEEEQKQVRHGH